MSTINIAPGHQDSERRVNVHLPTQETGLRVDVGDAYDRSKLEATVRVGSTTSQEATSADRREPHPKVARGGESPQTSYVRALLVLVLGVAMAITYTIIARDLSIALVPLVLLVSLGTLYLFALFLVPPSNRSEVRSFSKVLGSLIGAAFPKRAK